MPFTGMVYAFHFDQVLSARALNETPKITITLIKSNPLAYENKIELIKKAAHDAPKLSEQLPSMGACIGVM